MRLERLIFNSLLNISKNICNKLEEGDLVKNELKKIRTNRNNGIITGIGSISTSVLFLSREGLTVFVVFSGIVGVLCLLLAYKIHREINK